MCIFTGEVERVAGTRIFARLEADWQYLAYDLEFESQLETAMLLPLPVALPSNPDSVTFISLEHVSSFFDDLETSFESDGGEMPRSATLGGDEPLKVVSVGSFEASFVPSPGDFGRLDPRFQLPADVWERKPGYQDYGFAVFKLKPGNHRVHPMALKFRTPGLEFAVFSNRARSRSSVRALGSLLTCALCAGATGHESRLGHVV